MEKRKPLRYRSLTDQDGRQVDEVLGTLNDAAAHDSVRRKRATERRALRPLTDESAQTVLKSVVGTSHEVPASSVDQDDETPRGNDE